MSTRNFVRRAALVALAGLALAGCRKDSSSVDPDAIRNILVGVRIDPPTLYGEGEFVLALVPQNGRQESVISDTLDIGAKVTTSSLGQLTVGDRIVVPPDGRAIATAIALDYSLSMTDNDPNFERINAARLYWTAVLQESASNQVALAIFPGQPASSGFETTRLLQDWTSDGAALNAALTGNFPTPSGTFLYQSATELSAHIAATRPDATYRRVLLIVTDGMPDDQPSERSALFAAAERDHLTIHTVGIGPASDQSGNADAGAVSVLREIATRTGGLYAGATGSTNLGGVFKGLAVSTATGELLVTVKLDTPPAPGTKVQGTVTVGNDFGSATRNWEFTAP